MDSLSFGDTDRAADFFRQIFRNCLSEWRDSLLTQAAALPGNPISPDLLDSAFRACDASTVRIGIELSCDQNGRHDQGRRTFRLRSVDSLLARLSIAIAPLLGLEELLSQASEAAMRVKNCCEKVTEIKSHYEEAVKRAADHERSLRSLCEGGSAKPSALSSLEAKARESRRLKDRIRESLIERSEKLERAREAQDEVLHRLKSWPTSGNAGFMQGRAESVFLRQLADEFAALFVVDRTLPRATRIQSKKFRLRTILAAASIGAVLMAGAAKLAYVFLQPYLPSGRIGQPVSFEALVAHPFVRRYCSDEQRARFQRIPTDEERGRVFSEDLGRCSIERASRDFNQLTAGNDILQLSSKEDQLELGLADWVRQRMKSYLGHQIHLELVLTPKGSRKGVSATTRGLAGVRPQLDVESLCGGGTVAITAEVEFPTGDSLVFKREGLVFSVAQGPLNSAGLCPDRHQ